MLVVTNVIVMIFMTSFTLAADGHVIIAGARGSLRPDMNDLVFDDDVVFEVRGLTSTLRCAAACWRHACCFTFTTTPCRAANATSRRVLTCRGHASLETPSRPKRPSAGSRTFHMSRPLSGSSWLNSGCPNGICPGNVSATECFAGHCLCQPGYYYSYCQDGCVPDCSSDRLLETFVRYPNRHIRGNNIQTVRNLGSPNDCKAACLLRSDCRSLDLEMVYRQCWLQSVTALDKPAAFEYHNNDDYHQRTCL